MARIRLRGGWLAGLVVLGGCVDMFIGDPPRSAARWRGVTSAGPTEVAGCGPLAVDVAIYEDRLYQRRVVDGVAEPTAPVTGFLPRATDAVTTWWIEGRVDRADLIQFETGRQRPVYFRAKPYAVWRGNIGPDRATLAESGSPCNRELVLTRG